MKILVLAGGNSTERDVSLVSGTGVYKALKRKGHDVVLADVYMGIDLSDDELENVFSLDRDFSEGIRNIGEISPDIKDFEVIRGRSEDGFFGKNILKLCKMADIVFLALHGMNGEDGRIQATLDLLGIKYTGTDYVSSAMAMDKGLTKAVFEAADIRTPKGFSVKKGGPLRIGDIIYPCVVKTSHGGSSVGVYFVNKEEELTDALNKAFSYENDVVIEQFIKGREMTCAVLNGQALPIVEIIPKSGRYDYKNKYQPGATQEICPADCSYKLTKKVQKTAEEAYMALRLMVYARMDFIVDEDENVWCLEANTLPGMTPTSLIPQEAAAVGIDYDELCQRLVELSLNKYD